MPVVIKELVITATVDAAAMASEVAQAPAPDAADLYRQLLWACVAQVLAVLREQAER